MMHLFINGLGASAGGGLTYLRNVIPQLSRRLEVRTTLASTSSLAAEFNELPRVSLFCPEPAGQAARRFWYEQTVLPSVVGQSGVDVLVSTGNFALRECPVPQILLSRNSLYLSRRFSRDLLSRREFKLWLETRVRSFLARKSIQWADCTIAPSQSFAQDLQQWSGSRVFALHHGFDRQEFVAGPALPIHVQNKLAAATRWPKLLFVSHYNYYRNFETLLFALRLLREQPSTRNARLVLTCRLSDKQPGDYASSRAAALVERLGISDQIIELGSVPYDSLHRLYEACDIYVTPAYAESFAHPLVEAMSMGLPIVASDLSVHREICQDAAIYFPWNSPRDLASAITELIERPDPVRAMAGRGQARSLDFSWERHVDRLLAIARRLASGKAAGVLMPEASDMSTVA